MLVTNDEFEFIVDIFDNATQAAKALNIKNTNSVYRRACLTKQRGSNRKYKLISIILDEDENDFKL